MAAEHFHSVAQEMKTMTPEVINREERQEARGASCSPLESHDLQSGILHPRPSPYVGTYIVFRIDDRHDGRTLVGRLGRWVASAAEWSAQARAWLTVTITYQGLRALGVPQESLDSFPPEFREGMAARAELLGDVGVNAPEHWEKPLGTPDVHIALAAIAPDAARLAVLIDEIDTARRDLAGIADIWRQDCYSLPTEREAFGFKDGISHPAIEGSGIPGSNPQERPLKAGEFILGYPNELGELPPSPAPDILGRNGTYVVFRKLHQNVAAFRQYLRANAANREGEELLAAKFVGRWRSGAPLSLSPDRDDPALGDDPSRNNDFLYHEDDARGLKCPIGSHIRRMNPRDAIVTGDVRLHRMIRRGTNYGPHLPEGVLAEDGEDRGLCFVFVGASLARQFEFVQMQWINDGRFIGAPAERDPLVGGNEGRCPFTIPGRPVRRRLQGLPTFVTTRGGEYCFAPSLSALRWLSELDT
jgi:Dyp-type peroxidase family